MDLTHLEHTKQKFAEMANTQERKGIQKYGQPLDPLEGRDWLTMCSEEMVDGYKYLVAEQEKRKFIANKIRRLTDDPEIDHWLDALEGRI
ncbi:hypothetical protein GCM10007063_05800 [Lentibacillus kapialis]|uniref:Uncharacterized protein n=1 Tax=Lentibacillus kapialis TaxID=340214 RepID=A0A917PPM3_9BACI|nr:hypothetical protein [Lentibacillus kapialis]GGJ86142.1 hypothetical protein GCM10007063_05800 [Lentibacillus kapialis]